MEKDRSAMLTDNQREHLADVLIWGMETARKGKFRRGDIVLLQYDPAALPLAEILYTRILERKMNPVQRMTLSCGMEKNYFLTADDRQLIFLAPGDRELYDRVNGRIFLRAPDSLTHLKQADPRRIAKTLRARKPLRDILDHREDAGRYGWTLCTLPTPELARQARMSLKAYTTQVVRACYLDSDHPVGEWRRILAEARAIKKWLNGLPVKTLRLESAEMDLQITPGEMRRWVGISGHNIPSFELFLSPDWRGTKGTFYANLPSYRSGNIVRGVRLTFRRGSVCVVTAAEGEDFAVKQLAMDRGAKRVGEFSLTDRRFSRIDRFMADTLFDENFGGDHGNCHIALGSSYSDAYAGDTASLTAEAKKALGFNDSALHWDLVNTEPKTVTAHLRDGKRRIIYENGSFRR